ncbi:rCG22261, isoform CRA_b [Rattus norvegicus]|uniref:RCG22261, isoform CRA_b n=1 Tax=Rattus norvegicus TaxID=10116 RepID=A6INA2_RAT|nr:rCG22261, isoform CRA_b [Rattus norvegicus]
MRAAPWTGALFISPWKTIKKKNSGKINKGSECHRKH